MSKALIAIDIDDVLAAHAEAFVAYSNQKWSTHLAPDDYDERWEVLWQTDYQETVRRASEFMTSGAVAQYKTSHGAKQVLERLAHRYDFVIVTSRHKLLQQDTRDWIDRWYEGLFKEIHFVGMWDEFDKNAHLATKADLAKQINANYLIDDQPKHCLAAVETGIEAILFGDYGWNRRAELSTGTTRCHDWAAVEEYFNARG